MNHTQRPNRFIASVPPSGHRHASGLSLLVAGSPSCRVCTLHYFSTVWEISRRPGRKGETLRKPVAWRSCEGHERVHVLEYSICLHAGKKRLVSAHLYGYSRCACKAQLLNADEPPRAMISAGLGPHPSAYTSQTTIDLSGSFENTSRRHPAHPVENSESTVGCPTTYKNDQVQIHPRTPPTRLPVM